MKKYLILILLACLGCSKHLEDEQLPVLKNPYQVINDINYNQASYHTRIPFPEQLTYYRRFSDWHPPLEAVVLDYDKDGYLDIIETSSDYGTYNRNKIIFKKGTESGELIDDIYNSDKFEGLIHGRKGIVGDFNNDSWPDIFFVGHGFDAPPWPGEYPILLLNQKGKDFKYVPFKNVSGFFHTATSGDIDSDGDLDIVIIDGAKGVQNSYLFLNEGGIFTTVPIHDSPIFSPTTYKYFQSKYTAELIDLNNDSYLDLVIAGHEFEEWNTPPVVLYGSSSGFNTYKILPIDHYYGVVPDLDFFDLNNDGKLEIIMMRTKHSPFYSSFKISVYDNIGNDISSELFNNSDNVGKINEEWIYWLSILTVDSKVVIRGDDMRSTPLWELINGKYSRTR